jgi:hypothetical protein
MDHCDPSKARTVSHFQAIGVQSAAGVTVLSVSLTFHPAVRCTHFFPVYIGACYPQDDYDRLLLWIRMRGAYYYSPYTFMTLIQHRSKFTFIFTSYKCIM